MKALLFGAAALLAAAVGLGPAVAKDLEGAAPVVAQWTGPFVGIHGGWGQANRNGCFDFGVDIFSFTLLPAPDPIQSCDNAKEPLTFDYNQSGGLFGFQAGYNWQAAQNFILGVEFSASATGMTGMLDGALGGEGRWNSLVTATAKAGVTTGAWLWYVEGGYAVANASFMGDLGCDFDMTHSGPVVGAGVGVKLSQHVSLDLKYNHIWLDAQQAQCTSGVLCFIDIPTQIRTQGSMDIVKLGLNFHLGPTGI
jgi:opacity protein-like surface antigen